MSNIATVPTHVAGDAFTAAMWTVLQQNINDGIVNQVCAARVYSTNNFTTSSTLTAIPMNAERYDGDNMHSNTSNNTQLVCNTAGVYRVGGCVQWPSTATGHCTAALRVNGSVIIAQIDGPADSVNTKVMGQLVNCDWLFAQGDYVELCVSNNGAAAVQASTDYSPELWMSRA